jgi:hypothetical protein
MTIADAMHECRFSGSRSAPGIADISSMAFNPFGKTFLFSFFLLRVVMGKPENVVLNDAQTI